MSTANSDNADAAAAPTTPTPLPTNFSRLRAHLKPGSLAERLLVAQVDAAPGAAQAALQSILDRRLEELRLTHAESPDTKD